MRLETKILIAVTSLLILLAIISLVRRKRLDEKYALLWIVGGTSMLAAPLLTPLIDALSYSLGFYSPPSFVFLMAFFALCLINLQFSVVISRLSKQNRVLAQQFALMEQRLKQVEKAGGPGRA